MGDSRASIKIEFSIYGETYKADMNINWTPYCDGEGVDSRVIEFFEKSYERARLNWNMKNFEAEREQREREVEENEKREYELLRAKFETA